jgi:spermidine/putrescine transport system ATP-binding protein
LDLKLRKEMQLELKALQQQLGITFVYVTHDQEEALTMSDRIAVMSQGKVLQLGPAVEIYERPTSRFVADFIGESNFLNGRVKSLKGDQALVSIDEWQTELLGLRFANIRVGDDVAVSIRPEKIRLREVPDEASNCFEGAVITSTYIGSDTRVYVNVRGHRIKVWEQNRTSRMDTSASYSPGHKVWVSLDPENTLVLSKD